MPQKPKVLDSPGARVTDICEPLYMGAGLELGSSAIIMHFCLFAYFVFFWGGGEGFLCVVLAVPELTL